MPRNIIEGPRRLIAVGLVGLAGAGVGIAADRAGFLNIPNSNARTSTSDRNPELQQNNTLAGKDNTNPGENQDPELSPAPSLLEGLTEPAFDNIPAQTENVEVA